MARLAMCVSKLGPPLLCLSLAAGCVPADVALAPPPPSATSHIAIASPTLPPLTPTPSVPSTCPVPAGDPEPADLRDRAGVAEAILSFLNSGGSIVDLLNRIEAAGLAGGQGDPSFPLDLDGDGWLDHVIALANTPVPEATRRAGGTALPPINPSEQRGSLLVLRCQGDHYVADTLAASEANATPVLHAAAELTSDSSADLVLGWRTCGAHTCFERVEVLSATGPQLFRRPLDPSEEVPYPEVTIAPDGLVAITATDIGSVGAGPFRRFTRAWEWEPVAEGFRQVSEEFELPRYRIHALLDADAAARGGDLQTALDLYHRVALDDSLLDWVDPATERANLTGYSMFRVVLTYLGMHDWGDAQKAYGILQNQYPSGSVGQAYASMAQAFWDEWEATNDPVQGCRAARGFAEAHATEILAPLHFGYANPAYAVIDVCPGEGW